MSSAALKSIAQNPLVSRARDLYSHLRDKRRGTWSQHGEDVWLDNYFAGRRGGFYVDIGASHPTRLSNTWKLYSERGWHGITVEPIMTLAEAQRRWRPRDMMVQACIGTKPGRRTFYEMSPSVLSTLDEATALAAVAAGTASHYRTYDISVITMAKLLETYLYVDFYGDGGRYNDDGVDLLSVDMEGLDADVLTDYAFDRFRPRVIIAEANDEATRMRLLGHLYGRCGYRHAAELGCNLVFTDGR